MAEDMENEQEQISPAEQRIKDLSAKVKLTSEERDEQKKLLKEREEALAQSTKEVEFYKGFTALTSKYAAAGEFQDKIKEKVLAGYDVEDATIAVLSREGKLEGSPTSESVETPTAPPKPKESPAGGSAPTALKSADKEFGEMSHSERREALIELENESGAVSTLFNRHLQ